MKSTAYTKGLLLLIALFLGIIACRPSVQSDSARAQNSAKLNLQVLCETCLISGRPFLVTLDQNTGKVWAYSAGRQGEGLTGILGEPIYLGTMSEVGKPLQIQK
jgi:hypothetical protein